MATPIDTPAPLRLPAILQNSTNVAQRQVEAHNAQQREKITARREAKTKVPGAVGNGRGKRVVRRIDNAAFTDNPHIVLPRRTDLLPSVPLHPRPSRPSFPPSALDRSTPIPGAALPDKDPFSESSLNGAFTTSLKGTRALLRKRGQRAESVVGKVEGVVRGWLGGEGTLDAERGEEWGWKIVDEVLVDMPLGAQGSQGTEGDIGTSPIAPVSSLSASGSRRLPPQHRVDGFLPALPITQPDKGHLQVPAVLELSRSVAHLSLAAADPFDRLVIHLLARYYECLSWSEEHLTSTSQHVRLTHLTIPSITRPRAPTTHNLLTPETTDISDLSGLSSSERTASENGVSDESGTDTETERGTEIDPNETFRAEEGYTLDQDDPPHTGLSKGLRHMHIDDSINHVNIQELSLERTESAGSSMYASSEADSDYSSVGGMGDSMTFPLIPRTGRQWTGRDDISDTGSLAGVPLPGTDGMGIKAVGQVRRDTGWADKPTFFEYLYGA